MRVQSSREKKFVGGEVGWIHPLDPNRPLPKPGTIKPRKEYKINATKILREWSQQLVTADLVHLAKMLGVSFDSLRELGCVPAPWKKAWGFPMKDGYGNNVGIRVRNEEGQKWAVTGSHAGIFYPNYRPPKRVVAVEGPTDSAAALTMGLYPIGRPSCSGGVDHILTFVRKNHVEEMVLVADNDEPGIKGATDLQKQLPIPSCLFVLPTKDMRVFIKVGDLKLFNEIVTNLTWAQPRKTT